VIKRTIEISREPAHLAVRNRQLLLKREGAIVGSIPCEDIGVVVVDHPQTTYTHGALASLADSDAAVVICGDNHLPIAVLLPLASHSQVVTRLNLQLGVSVPLAKQLWKQVVAAKVRAQAANLAEGSAPRKKLLALAREVKSGDPSNIEAQAAKLYWQHWLWDAEEGEPSPSPLPGERELGGSPQEGAEGVSPRFQRAEMGDRPRANSDRPVRFRRDADGEGLNHFLNYGYTIVRAAVARAIVAAGLLPSLGVHHKHRGNAFCLADDLMEPLRPLVDDRVREMHRLGYEELNQTAKKELLELLTQPVELGGQTGPLMVMLHRMTASLVRCYGGEGRTLEIPTPVGESPVAVAVAEDDESSEV
jgi:CRISPR-associated protein Cas1